MKPSKARWIREHLGLTQEAMAACLCEAEVFGIQRKVKRQNVTQFETGDRRITPEVAALYEVVLRESTNENTA